MTLSEVHKRLGSDVTLRQFRRYVDEGVFPAGRIAKNPRGWLMLTIPPSTDAAWARLAQRIQKWREDRYARGWSKRPKAKTKKKDSVGSQSGHLALENIHLDFLRWLDKASADGFPENWSNHQTARVEHLLGPMAEAYHAARHKRLAKQRPDA